MLDPWVPFPSDMCNFVDDTGVYKYSNSRTVVGIYKKVIGWRWKRR